MTGTESTHYYRTMHGSHRHVEASCASAGRTLFSSHVIPIPAAEVAEWAPCAHCCPAEVHASDSRETKSEAEADGYCLNTVPIPGSYNPRRYQVRGHCATCGATDVSVTQTMKLRKHRRPV